MSTSKYVHSRFQPIRTIVSQKVSHFIHHRYESPRYKHVECHTINLGTTLSYPQFSSSGKGYVLAP